MTISQFNTEYDATLDDTNYTTVGGLLFGQLGRLPKPGDVVQVGGFDFEILSMAGRRVERVRVLGRPQGDRTRPRRSDERLPAPLGDRAGAARCPRPHRVRRCAGGARSSGRRSRCSRRAGSRK